VVAPDGTGARAEAAGIPNRAASGRDVRRAGPRGRSRPSRWAAGACVLAGLVLWPAPPAWADKPADMLNFNPSHFDGVVAGHYPGSAPHSPEAQIASDLFDGVDFVYNMRAVATEEADYYEWYSCAAVADDPFAGECGPPIATDTAPTLSIAPPGVAQVASFEATWDLPPTPSIRTLRTAACIDHRIPPDIDHCRTEGTNPVRVHLDDASSTADHTATTAGQITQPKHGGAVANAGFTAVAFTSNDDIGRVFFCLDVGTNPTNESDAEPGQGCDGGSAPDSVPDDSPACVGVHALANCWAAAINPPDDAEFSFGIVEQDNPAAPVSSGSGDCEDDTLFGGDGASEGDDCQLDKIYLTSVVSPPQPPGSPGTGPQPAPVPQPGAPGTWCPGFQNDPRNQIIGTTSPDELVGSPGADIICGGSRRDVIRGRGGKDLLLGGPGNDRMKGGPGRDRCRGGPGRDTESRCES
jgi:hypothetical protein